MAGKQQRLIWKWALFLILIGLIVWGGVTAVRIYEAGTRRVEVSNAMRQMGAAFELYANASAGNYYPLRSGGPTGFLPDRVAWAAVGDGLAEFDAAYDVLTGNGTGPLCYLGYAFYDEASAHRVLDELEKNAEAYRGGGTRLEKEPILDPKSPKFEELAPLRKGVGRRFFQTWYVLWGPAGGDPDFDLPVPVLWQMPMKKGDRVPVLWLAGLSSMPAYPGEFPMSPLFINRVRGLMGLPQDPGFSMDTPIMPTIRALLEAGSREPGPSAGSLLHFDVNPSVTAGEATGYRIELTNSELVLFPVDQPRNAIAASELIESVNKEYHGLPKDRVVRFMGTGGGYHWYGKTDYGVFKLLEKGFELEGGEPLYDAAASYWLDEHPTKVWLNPHQPDERRPEEVLQRPERLSDYVYAYLIKREREGNPVGDEYIQALAILCGSVSWHLDMIGAAPTPDILEEASNRLLALAESDNEALVTLALAYIFPGPPKVGNRKLTVEKMAFIQRLPREHLLSTLRHLAESVQNEWDAEYCRKLLEKLEASKAIDVSVVVE